MTASNISIQLKLLSHDNQTVSMRHNISSGSKWESEVGYSRFVEIGPLIFISGTTAVDENGDIVGEGDPYKRLCSFSNLTPCYDNLQRTVANSVHVSVYNSLLCRESSHRNSRSYPLCIA